MNQYSPHLAWIDSQLPRMTSLLTRWSSINSGTYHLTGLHHFSQALQLAFASLNAPIQTLPLQPQTQIDSHGQPIAVPLGDALLLRKRPDAPLRIFLAIHTDTVYPADSPFQQTTLLDKNKLQGPGVADAKGGILILLIALECLERFLSSSGTPGGSGTPVRHSTDTPGGSGTPARHPSLGWELLLNPDEEIGSPGSSPLLLQAASRNHLGLLFEPALPDGSLVSERKGSGNFTLIVRGRSAHAGRNPEAGRSAIAALAQIILSLHDLPRHAGGAGLTLNVGQIEGGTALNIVPDLAIARFNIRLPASSGTSDAIGTPDAHPGNIQDHLHRLISSFNRDGISAELHGGITSPPKLMDEPTTLLMDHLRKCGADLGLTLNFHPTGGACDGNRLAAAGLPCLDSLGPRGGDIHSPSEFVHLDSLTERAKLTALFLMKLAAGEIPWPTERR